MTREVVHEAYSFVCLCCGHGWEQAFEIIHLTDPAGHRVVRYYADDQPVPSPLTHASCPSCGGGRIRILRAGRVNSARPQAAWRSGDRRPPAT